MTTTCTLQQQATKVGSPGSHHKLLSKKEEYHFNTYASQPFARETYLLVRELIYTLLAQEHNVHLNGHTNGVVPPNFNNQELDYAYKSLLACCRQFLKQHRLELQNKVNSLDISDSFLYANYHKVLNKMFEDQVNWGRVIAMLCLTEALAFRVHTELMSPNTIESLIGWQANFITESLQGWITDQQGGWCGLPDKFHPDKQHEAAKEEDSLGLGSLFTIAVVGLGATALAFLSR